MLYKVNEKGSVGESNVLNDTERTSHLERDLIPPVYITMVTVGECLTG